MRFVRTEKHPDTDSDTYRSSLNALRTHVTIDPTRALFERVYRGFIVKQSPVKVFHLEALNMFVFTLSPLGPIKPVIPLSPCVP